MIVRIVKLTFKIEQVEEFKKIFNQSKVAIRSFPDNLHLECLQDKNDPRIFFTYSHWESEDALENYRKSELFNSTWAKTKILFDAKPEAWSTAVIDQLE